MSQTTVSLPPHLHSNLSSLNSLLPEDIKTKLSPILTGNVTEISYSILQDISKWARMESARSQLQAASLDPNDYTLIAMLAGTITSPSSKLPPYVPPPDPAQQAKKAKEDRNAIVAILNALLSIGCVGYAAWWASRNTSWRDEWRILFALLATLTTGFAEGGLYFIYQLKKDEAKKRRWANKIIPTKKKDEGEGEERKETESVVAETESPQNIRKRAAHRAGEKAE